MRRYGVFAVACFGAVLLSSELGLSLPLAGVGPDLVVIVVAAFAVGASPKASAMAGFAVGLFRDLLLTTPKGLSALAYGLTAYAASLVGEVRGVWAAVALVAGSTIMSQTIFGVGAALVSGEVQAGPLPRVMFLTTAYNALVAPLLMPVLRRIAPPETRGTQAATE